MSIARSVEISRKPTSSAVAWALSLGVAGCFIGHGAFGVITKTAWVPYFAVAGIDETRAWWLMPKVGAADILVGVLALAWPCRAIFIWATVWGFATAVVRPLAGEGWWEFWERAGNYGVPLAYLVAVGWRGDKWLRLSLRWPGFAAAGHVRLSWTLRLVTVALLAGHGGCILGETRASFAHNVAAVLPDVPVGVVTGVGVLEFAMAAGVLIRPSLWLLVGVSAWKLASESLFLFAGSPVWEIVERFGSYTAPLALAFLLARRRLVHTVPAELLA